MSKKRLNTKFVGHHVSAGGFIFTGDLANKKMQVVLIKNKKGEYWIPKGHVEPGEDYINATFREIKEEVGLSKNQIKFVDFSHIHEYSFVDDNGESNTKEIYISIFYSKKPYQLKLEKGETEIVDGGWFEYQDALNKIIPYNKEALQKAKEIIIKYNAKKTNTN